MCDAVMAVPQRINLPSSDFSLPDGAEPSKEMFGEWLVRSGSLPCLQKLPHRTGYPCFYLVSNGHSYQFVCVIRWGRKKYRIQLESDPCETFAAALADVCNKAAAIPELEEDIKWKDILSAARPDLPTGSISFENIVPIGEPRFVCTFHSPGRSWCSSLPQNTMRSAFDALVGCVEVPPPPPPPEVKTSTLLPDLQKQLQALVETPLKLNSSEIVSSDRAKCFGLHANWVDADGTRRKVSTEGHYDTLAAAVHAMEIEIRNTLEEGPRHPKPPICRQVDTLAEDVLVEYRGNSRPICRIKVRGLGEVESNASAHRTAAYSDALKLVVKLKKKRTDSLAMGCDEPTAAMMARWLDEAKKRWLEEREFLMALTPVHEIDRRRLQQLSLFLAFLEPLRKYELAPSQRKPLAMEMVEEITQALLRQKPELFKANMTGYLRFLGRCVYCDPGHRVNLDHRFIRQSLLLRDSPKIVLEQLLANRLLRKERDGFAVSTLGANLMEQSLRDGFGKPTALGVALPTDILQALAVLREQLAKGP